MIRRREALGALAAIAGAASGCAFPSTRARSPVDLATASGRVRAFALMRGALDDRVVIGNVVGSYHGVIGTAVEPLFGLVGATFSVCRGLPDGGFAIVSFEQAYYTSLDGSRVLDETINPYTGATVRVPVWTGQPMIQFVDADLRIRPAKPPPSPVRVTQGATVVQADRDEVTFVERLSVDSPRGGYSEIVTLRAALGAITAPDAKQVGCRTSFTSVVAWRDWLGMGDRPGHLMAHGAGAYGIAATALPALFVDETQRRRPEALAEPASILTPALVELDALLAAH